MKRVYHGVYYDTLNYTDAGEITFMFSYTCDNICESLKAFYKKDHFVGFIGVVQSLAPIDYIGFVTQK